MSVSERGREEGRERERERVYSKMMFSSLTDFEVNALVQVTYWSEAMPGTGTVHLEWEWKTLTYTL